MTKKSDTAIEAGKLTRMIGKRLRPEGSDLLLHRIAALGANRRGHYQDIEDALHALARRAGALACALAPDRKPTSNLAVSWSETDDD